jgi:hypothetical protein
VRRLLLLPRDRGPAVLPLRSLVPELVLLNWEDVEVPEACSCVVVAGQQGGMMDGTS